MKKNIVVLLLPLLFLTLPYKSLAENATIGFNYPDPSPKDVTINVGDTVTWDGDGPSADHPLQQASGATSNTAVSGGFSSTSKPFQFQFNTAGTFYYRCLNHGSFPTGTMRGSITVLASGQPTAAPTAIHTSAPTNTPDTECEAKPGVPILTAPVNGSSLNKKRVSLNWIDTTCADEYTAVIRKDKKSGKISDQSTVTKSAYKTIELEKGHKYFWTVKACNSAGCSKASAPFSFSLK
jgi:plastocyanin